jgi:competence protein ComEC
MIGLAGSQAGRWAASLWGAFALGCAAGFVSSLQLDALVPAALAVAACSLICAAISTRRFVGCLAVGLAVLLGLLRGGVGVVSQGPGAIAGNLGSRPLTLIGTVRSAGPGTGAEAIIDATRLSDHHKSRAVTGGVLVSGPLIPALSPGDVVEVDAAGLRALNRRPGAGSAQSLERSDVEAMAVAPQVFVLAAGGPSLARGIAWVQGRLVAAVDGSLPEPAAALLLGIAFGIHEPLSAAVRAPLQDAGLIHIVVVSGLKVVLLLGVVRALGGVLEWSRRRTLLVALPLMTSYVLISGAGPAAIRSALMAGAAMFASSAGRRTDPVPMLALVAGLMLATDPGLIADPGFQLSFLGTAGILLLAEPIARRLPGPRLLVEPFAVTVAAQLATLPIMGGTFGVIALAGPVANALVLPLLPFMMVTGASGAILSSLLPGLGWLLLQVTGVAAAAIVDLATGITAIPGAAIQVGNWPAAWSIAELAGLAAGLAVLAVTSGMRRPVELKHSRSDG